MKTGPTFNKEISKGTFYSHCEKKKDVQPNIRHLNQGVEITNTGREFRENGALVRC